MSLAQIYFDNNNFKYSKGLTQKTPFKNGV